MRFPKKKKYTYEFGADAIIDEETGEVVIDFDQWTEELHKFFANFTDGDFSDFCELKPHFEMSGEGPAFIDADGQFYFANEHMANTVHAGIVEPICDNYAKEKYGFVDEDTFWDFFNRADEEFFGSGQFEDWLDDICAGANLIRINTGTTAYEEKFYMVLFNRPTRAQQYAIEEFIDWGQKEGIDQVGVYCDQIAGDNWHWYLLGSYDPKDIVQKINRAFNSGELLEDLDHKPTTLDAIQDFNDKMNNDFEWQLVLKDGNEIVNQPDLIDDTYKTLSPEQFEQYGGGCCWDYVPYQEQYFNDNFPDIEHQAYFHCLGNEEDTKTHTFMLFWINDSVYWFESAWNDYKGVYQYKSEQEALVDIINKLEEDSGIDKIDFSFTIKYDSLNNGYIGISADDYMNTMSEKIGTEDSIDNIKG